MPGNLYERPSTDDVAETELTDGDILDAMQHIPGYLDITTEDFRTIYHLAHRHAVERMFGHVKVANLMRLEVEALQPDMSLVEAAKILARSGSTGLPVVDSQGCVIGMLTESDFLRRLKVATFLELLLNLLDDTFEFSHRCHETPVREAMVAPVVTVTKDAGFGATMAAFHQHGGRSMPVVSSDGRLLGLILRKDFHAAYSLDKLL
ncbi:MAG: CBS domain-containing protein [Pseudomonadota bacterium]|nr:CBS domain-containing protein [Gammaproteobacteria bacterium]MBU1732306.1 CBS domain-containing protein [Gammaproteobacteria bacterium]MBU1893876.1 CBS domain-containing protein [Gammaproteobacteria bacterium]